MFDTFAFTGPGSAFRMMTVRVPDFIVNRPPRETALAFGAAWLAFMTGLVVGGELKDAGSFVFAAATGAVLVFLGFAAAWRCRVLPRGATVGRRRLAVSSLAAGAALGIANLAANWAIAGIDPRVRALLEHRMATVAPLDGVISAPLVEEVVVRLFLMSAIAWAASRFVKPPALVFAIALVGSAVFFAALHLGRPFPDAPAVANYYRAALLVKYTLAGLPLGWIFWRWGLPYSILSHAAANAAHLALQDRVF